MNNLGGSEVTLDPLHFANRAGLAMRHKAIPGCVTCGFRFAFISNCLLMRILFGDGISPNAGEAILTLVERGLLSIQRSDTLCLVSASVHATLIGENSPKRVRDSQLVNRNLGVRAAHHGNRQNRSQEQPS
jgi:hypothetical protein